MIQKSSNPQHCKEIVLNAILATDMGSHFRHISELKEKREGKSLDLSDSGDKQVEVVKYVAGSRNGLPCFGHRDWHLGVSVTFELVLSVDV